MTNYQYNDDFSGFDKRSVQYVVTTSLLTSVWSNNRHLEYMVNKGYTNFCDICIPNINFMVDYGTDHEDFKASRYNLILFYIGKYTDIDPCKINLCLEHECLKESFTRGRNGLPFIESDVRTIYI